MNDGKSIDDTKALPLSASTNEHTTSVGENQEFNQRRRRLMRGAAGLAPVILTLRSGAAAAALSGCAPILGDATVSTDGDGKILSPPTGIIATDFCIDTNPSLGTVVGCDPSPSNTLHDIRRSGTGTPTKVTVSQSGSDFSCPNLKSNTTIAIVSAATSVF